MVLKAVPMGCIDLRLSFQERSAAKFNHRKYMDAPRTTMSTSEAAPSASNRQRWFTLSSDDPYEDCEGAAPVCTRRQVKKLLIASELNKTFGNHDLRLGVNEWYYHRYYSSFSAMDASTVLELSTVADFHNF